MSTSQNHLKNTLFYSKSQWYACNSSACTNAHTYCICTWLLVHLHYVFPVFGPSVQVCKYSSRYWDRPNIYIVEMLEWIYLETAYLICVRLHHIHN